MVIKGKFFYQRQMSFRQATKTVKRLPGKARKPFVPCVYQRPTTFHQMAPKPMKTIRLMTDITKPIFHQVPWGT